MPEVLSGRCLCGAVRYECGRPVIPTCFCHCESCRRAAGAHMVAWATVPRDSFRVVAGSLRECASSAPVIRQFCASCGTQVTYWNRGAAHTIDITLATLDDPGPWTPQDHIWMEDALAWDRPGDGLPQYRQTRRGARLE